MAGLDAYGTTLARGDRATPTELFTAIANVVGIGPPTVSRDTYDVSAHDGDGWREFVGSALKDGGEVSIDLNYDPAVHSTLVADLDETTPRNHQITFPDGTIWLVGLLMTEFEQGDAPIDGKLEASVTYKVSGEPTITPAP